ncbi:zinc metallopeptidase [Saccharicrinis fermentans]|uniref:Putative neutral zinc metallopeptidase n=1 Tax=Saccharicrinis fermentans DSM 9555 = JCM 21142 TaxID=869213 RepID=W7Y7J6_9BACT|nr:zinc metallopeptidase [Saccharicrinis fermentans]GAF04227.1 putative neutral zinc metallopeptidase [Saccharicrinis fermentans DSM 9555 = JCM 21142]
MYDPFLLLIFGAFFLLSWIVSSRLKSKFKKYAKIPMSYGMTGRDVAEKMLKDNGIYDVKVVSVPGKLTDHYNPANRTVNLSPEVYSGQGVSSAAVAAHECGHAVQHAQGYAPLEMRSALVPIQNISGSVLNIIFMVMIFGAFLLPGLLPYKLALQIIIMCYSVFTLFAFVTLPVEINATQRALTWLDSSGVATGAVHDKAKDALKWAAYTYVVAALSSLVTLLYYVLRYVGMDD